MPKITIKSLLSELKRLNLPADQFAVFGSGPMAIRGIRQAKDLDVAIKDDFFNLLKEKYKEAKPGQINVGNIEIFAAWNSLLDNAESVIDRADIINGVRFIKLNDLMIWKKKLGREKDLLDIKIIKDYLKKVGAKKDKIIKNTK